MSFYSIKLFVDEERSRPVGRVYMHLTYDQRLAIKQMLERGNSKKEIAESIGVHTSTIYREIDRGTVNGHYDPTAAEEAYQEKLAEKGPTAVLEENPELANYIAKLILNQKLSPEKIVNVVKENPRFSKISLTVSRKRARIIQPLRQLFAIRPICRSQPYTFPASSRRLKPWA